MRSQKEKKKIVELCRKKERRLFHVKPTLTDAVSDQVEKRLRKTQKSW